MSNKSARPRTTRAFEQTSERPTRKTRRQKVAEGFRGEEKEKFVKEREKQVRLKPIVPKSLKQEHYLDMLLDKEVKIIIASGIAGTGKTYLPSAVAAQMLKTKQIDKIIVARPYVTTGATTGFKPGSSLEKLRPFVRTMLDTMQKELGKPVFDIALDDGIQGVIEVQELESIRGRSFDEPSFLIVDEAQQSTPEEMLSIITRVSDNCKLVLCGDLRQRDLQGVSGLKWFVDFIARNNIQKVGYVEFNDIDDVVRGGVVKDVIAGLMADESAGLWTPQSK